MQPTPKDLLLVEDTATLSLIYTSLLRKEGFDVDTAHSVHAAREAFAAKKHPIIVLDLMLPDGNGIEVIDQVTRQNPDTRIIVVTASESVDLAVRAMRSGAFDYLVKPFEITALISAVENARQSISETQPPQSGGEGEEIAAFEGFIGKAPSMQAIYKSIELIGRSSATVFITGESGTGKEVCAQAIHQISSRRNAPFIALNCGAIPADLLESEVFGHRKGAFTGALADKPGAARAADGGTLFLDEICEMDLSLQTKLLRFLQTGAVQPLGETDTTDVDVRILCATNRDPEREVAEGRFREDLFYRLHVVPLHMPPLRERGEDVNLIALEALKRFAQEENKGFSTLSPELQAVFRAYDWPGNVRQLLNVLRNLVVLNDATSATPAMLPAGSPILTQQAAAAVTASFSTPDKAGAHSAEKRVEEFVGLTLAEMERRFILATLEKCDGSMTKAAHMLGVSPSTLYRKRESWES